METNFFFQETQYGLKNWIASIVTIFIFIPINIHLLFKMIDASGLDKFIFFSLVIFISILGFSFSLIKLKIEVTKNQIQYRLFPFHFSTQTLSKSEVVEVENVVYNPIGEWGGWGIRNNSKGKAYNMYGNKGVQVTLKSGKIILFGSQKPNELYEAIIQTSKP